VWPILFEHRTANLLVATTKLSHFVTGRYAPVDAGASVADDPPLAAARSGLSRITMDPDSPPHLQPG